MAGKHVLVIDDDRDVREALRLILEPRGYELTLCATGPEGRDAAAGRPPDVILLDIMLSTVSEGFHVAYDFRRDQRLGQVPIIMISSIGETMGMDFAKELGSEYLPADTFLSKPLQAATVIAAIEKVLARGGKQSDESV
jgi:CheY-like chemotaxis protein